MEAGACNRRLEIILGLALFGLAFGYGYGGLDFAQWGIPVRLSAAFGGIANFQPKLFPMEMLLGSLGITALLCGRLPGRPGWDRPLYSLALFLLAIGLARLLTDLPLNPLLAIRNAAFVWYLAFPLLLATLPISSRALLAPIHAHLLVLGILLLFGLMKTVLLWQDSFFYFTDTGLAYLVGFFLLTASPSLGWIGLGLISLSFGVRYFDHFQRTVLLGALATPLLLFLLQPLWPRHGKIHWKRLFALLPGFALGLLIALSPLPPPAIPAALKNANPLKKAELNSFGMEKFRLALWEDATEAFLSRPLAGVGFVEPVVKRIYTGWEFLTNEGGFEHAWRPPLAGPHNSYLNALARLGLWGALFLVLHGMAALLLLRQGWICAFLLLFSQMLYAFFQVGLEGPTRSFSLLLLVGTALRCEAEAAERRRSTHVPAAAPQQAFLPTPQIAGARKQG